MKKRRLRHYFVVILLLFLAACNVEDYHYTTTDNDFNITASEAKELIEQHKDDLDFMIIDVRSEGEYEDGHIPGAINLLYTNSNFTDTMQQYGKDTTYLFYCLSGGRSMSAIEKLIPLGFEKMYNVSGGIIEWKNEGYEVISE